jgi:hypothetical protein
LGGVSLWSSSSGDSQSGRDSGRTWSVAGLVAEHGGEYVDASTGQADQGGASSVDDGLMENFWSTMQRKLLDRRWWSTRAELGTAMFEWIEVFYNPRWRHSGIGYLSPVEYEALHAAATAAA